ncbi:MAG: hypothetical protein FJ095_02670 [Deltaproteobacteria bacterium]|nr:hypothetical protein [Deltaproteobacteria bacterium]
MRRGRISATAQVRLAAALGLGLMGVARDANADLRSEASRLAARYRELGATVLKAESHFLSAGRSVRVRTSLSPTTNTPCLTWIALGVRGAAFSLERLASDDAALVAPGHGEDGPEPEDELEGQGAPLIERSTRAGVAALTSCFDSAPKGGLDVGLVLASPRGAVEVIVVAHRGGLPPVDEVILERAQGPIPELVEPLPPLPVALLAERARSLSEQARRDGAGAVVSSVMPSRADGTGERAVRLEPGCHRLTLVADSGGEPADLDVELRTRGGAEPFRVDRSHASDARLELCLDEARAFELRWAGAGGALDVMLLDAHFERPTLPGTWSPAARAAVASVLWRRRAPRLGAPSLEWRGVAGTTRVPLRIEPGACYVVGLAVTPGDARDAFEPGGEEAGAGARLVVQVGLEFYQDVAQEVPRGAAVAFCAGASSLAGVTVEAHGTRVLSRVAVWRLRGPSP